MLQSFSKLICIAAFLSISFFVNAEGSPFYVKANLHNADYDLGPGGSKADTAQFGVSAGYAFSKHLAVEIGYQDFGKISITDPGTIDATADAFELSVVGGWPLNSKYSVYLQFGVDIWEASATATGVSNAGQISAVDGAVDIFYGFGGTMQLSDDISVFIEYQVHDLGILDINTAGLGFKLLLSED